MDSNPWKTILPFLPRGYSAMSIDIFDDQSASGIMCLEPGMLLTILQCTKQPPINTDYLVLISILKMFKTLFTECIFTEHSILFSWILPQIPHGEFLLWIILSISKSNMVQHIEIMKQCHTVPKNKMLKIFLEEWEKTKDCLYLL